MRIFSSILNTIVRSACRVFFPCSFLILSSSTTGFFRNIGWDPAVSILVADFGAVSCDAHAVIGGFGWGPRSAEIADGWRGFLHHLSEFAPLGPLVLLLRRLSIGGVEFVRLKARCSSFYRNI